MCTKNFCRLEKCLYNICHGRFLSPASLGGCYNAMQWCWEIWLSWINIVCACKELCTFMWLLQYCNDAVKMGWTELTLCAGCILPSCYNEKRSNWHCVCDRKVHLQAKVKCGCSLFLLHHTHLLQWLHSSPFWCKYNFHFFLRLIFDTMAGAIMQL